jgi:hypothetical protein
MHPTDRELVNCLGKYKQAYFKLESLDTNLDTWCNSSRATENLLGARSALPMGLAPEAMLEYIYSRIGLKPAFSDIITCINLKLLHVHLIFIG